MKLTRRNFLRSAVTASVIPFVFSGNADVADASLIDLSETRLADKLKLMADNIVGRVGIGSKTLKSVTKEIYQEVAFIFYDENEIIEKWVKFIKGYTVMAQNVYHGSVDATKIEPSIYWSTVPEILTRDGGIFMRDGYLLYACFLISNKTPATANCAEELIDKHIR